MSSHDVAAGNVPPVQQYAYSVLLQDIGISEVFVLVEAGLKWMTGQGIKPEQMTRMRSYRDVLARAHDARMFANERNFPVYVAAEAHSESQDVADLMTVADAAKELGYTVQHVRRLGRTGTLRRGAFGLIYRSDVLARKQRKRGA